MSRRSTPQRKIDEQAFPIRLKILVPEDYSFGMASEIENWMRRELGLGHYYTWSEARNPLGNVHIYLFRKLAHASALIERFPLLELADGTLSPNYYSPYFPSGMPEIERQRHGDEPRRDR